ncbi:hypothetical protein KTS45_11220 [Halomicroarcula limicola]|uniref:Uncharacterized protein n=1 Tax=Haloarcula limicola TaxID=1429915 RepID=A0A8J7YBD0_9EURY|nr:hypothetical protein [Halomicroarcula limicola]MBV0924769.1 hypothetical protein [Halomicroarcula limicola]
MHIHVDDGQKTDWENFIEHEEAGRKYKNVSDLVRKSVSEQISRDKGQSGVPDEVESMLYDILDEFSSLQAKMAMANEALDTLENQQLDEETVDEVVGFHRELIEGELEKFDRSNDSSGEDSA